uniref:Uncharacterized protein n=1 Tax=Anguilla anguilla TaxID=7936 RepID=A0A0E9T3A3_ANGAN
MGQSQWEVCIMGQSQWEEGLLPKGTNQE